MHKTKQFINKNLKLLSVVLVVLVVLIVLLGTRSNGTLQIREYEVISREVIKNINASGETKTNLNYVFKSPVSAKIKKILVRSGEEVKKDQVIIEFDELSLNASLSTTWQAYLAAKAAENSLDEQLKAAETAVSDKRYSRDSAQREYDEDNNFDNKQSLKTAQSSYDTALSNLQTLTDKKESIVQSVNSTLSTYLVAKDNFNNSKVKSPETGLIAINDLTPGDNILTGQELFSLTNSNILEFVAEVDEADVQQVSLQQPAVVELEGYPDKDFKGLVSLIDAQTKLTSSGSNIVETYIKISFDSVKPIIGLTGTAKIEIGKESEKLAVPFDSLLFEDSSNTFVYLISNGKAVKTRVEVGFEGDEYYAIKSGLNSGDKIITGTDITGIKDGQKVSVIKN